MPALFIYNDYLINQCYNMEYYCADQVMNMVFATSTAKAQHKEGKSPISKERGDRIYKLQTKSNDNVHALDSLMEQHNRALQDYNSLANSKVKQWHELVSDHVQQIIAKLQEMGFSLSENFKATLQKNLNKQGSDREISAEDVSEYEIKKQLSSIENAIVSSLIAEVKHESH